MYYVRWHGLHVPSHAYTRKVASRMLCTKTSLSFLQRIADLFLDLKIRNEFQKSDVISHELLYMTIICLPGSKRLSPAGLQHRMAAELSYLSAIEESVRQLSDVERVRGVSLAQQESVSLAQIIKVFVEFSLAFCVFFSFLCYLK